MSSFVFLGTGTSQGVPVIGCSCEVCSSHDPRDKRLRCSGYYITNQGTKVLIDIGPDFRQQALQHHIIYVDGILVTHSHYDHIGGLDEIRQINFIMKKAVTIYGDTQAIIDIKNRFNYIFNPRQIGGGIPQIELHPIDDKPFSINETQIQPLRIFHGILPIYGYRIENFAYITDASAIPQETQHLIQGIDTLVINALRYKPHPTHFNLEQAIEFIQKVRPREAYLIHLTDAFLHKKVSTELPSHVHLAYDGLTLTWE